MLTVQHVLTPLFLLLPGKCVSRQQRVHGVDFCYQPPPRNIVPCAAALKGQPVGLRCVCGMFAYAVHLDPCSHGKSLQTPDLWLYPQTLQQTKLLLCLHTLRPGRSAELIPQKAFSSPAMCCTCWLDMHGNHTRLVPFRHCLSHTVLILHRAAPPQISCKATYHKKQSVSATLPDIQEVEKQLCPW